MHLALDEVRDDLRVGFCLEDVPLLLELVFQLEVVLDDAVVNDDDSARAVTMRVCVLLGGTAVRGPSCVADTVNAFCRVVAQRILEIHQLAGGPPERDALGADERHASRVVAAILHAPQPVDAGRARQVSSRCIR